MRQSNPFVQVSLVLLLGMGIAACGTDTNAENASASDGITTVEESTSATESSTSPTLVAAAPASSKTSSTPSAREGQMLAAAETESKPVCTTCGSITGIEKKTEDGKGTGLGAATGAVLGAIAGREIVKGKRSGRDAAAVVGAVGGGYAGHKIEEKARSTTYYQISIRMDSDQRIETVTRETADGWNVGDKVHLEDGKLSRR